MTPEEKSKELIKKMGCGFQHTIDDYTAKECILIAIDEIQEAITKYDNHMKDYAYWQQVKKYIIEL